MDGRAILINKISKDILGKTQDLTEIRKEVEEYAKILEDAVRNVYELLTMDDYCPLFVLCHYLGENADNYCMSEEEFEKQTIDMLDKTNKMFNTSITIN